MVYTTLPSVEAAKRWHGRWSKRKMAACVNIVRSVISIYRWDGAIAEDAEVAMLIKTRRGFMHYVFDDIQRQHPYAAPAIIAYDIVGRLATYLNWIGAEPTSGSHAA